jgi:2-hydroxychromene-2-carboxylate isomerase
VAAAVFYFDFNSPYAYLAAARIEGLVPGAEWRPIAFPLLLHEQGRLEAAMARDPSPIVAEVSRRAADRGLPPFNPPQGWPLHAWSLAPLRAALFAGDSGRMREFCDAAFRAMFVEGRSLVELDTIRDAAREAGLDATEVEEAIQRPEVKQRLKGHTEEALARGVTGIPTVAIGDELFWGDDRLEEAAAAASDGAG